MVKTRVDTGEHQTRKNAIDRKELLCLYIIIKGERERLENRHRTESLLRVSVQYVYCVKTRFLDMTSRLKISVYVPHQNCFE